MNEVILSMKTRHPRSFAASFECTVQVEPPTTTAIIPINTRDSFTPKSRQSLVGLSSQKQLVTLG